VHVLVEDCGLTVSCSEFLSKVKDTVMVKSWLHNLHSVCTVLPHCGSLLAASANGYCIEFVRCLMEVLYMCMVMWKIFLTGAAV